MTDAALAIPTAKVFVPLLAPNRYKGAHGGRGSGKSHFFADLAVEWCLMKPASRIVCVREVQRSLKESVKLLIEDKIRKLGVERRFKSLHDRIETPGGGVILFQGMQEHTKESIKSLEGFDVAYVEEAQTMTGGSLEMLRPTIRKEYTDGTTSEIWFSWNPRSASDPVDVFLRGDILPPEAVVVESNYRDNPFFPAVLEQERAFDEIHKPDRYEHIWGGAYEPMAAGAIWNMPNINQNRVKAAPKLTRVLVGIDPAITTEGNEHGIIGAGLGEDGRGYVLDDASLKGTPQDWAERAIAVYDMLEADGVVVEINQGGDMVKHTLQSVRPSLPIIMVRATRGKHVRAEPISALYSMNKVSHVGAFPQLEAQMCRMTAWGYDGDDSPDRVDALVWAMTELFPSMLSRTGFKGPIYEPSRGPGGWMSA